jgi:hypothetical protein
MTAPRHVRVFLSSPGDVSTERGLALDLLGKLDTAPLLRGQVTIEVVSWDDPNAPVPMDAALTPQEAVNRRLPLPSECDITICILWGRIGTPLHEPRRSDGSQYLSGTEWEFENARLARRTILLYRRTTPVTVVVTAPDIQEKQRQTVLVGEFFDRLRGADDSYLAGYTTYDQPAEFEARLRTDLEGVLRGLLPAIHDTPLDATVPAGADLSSLSSDGLLVGLPTIAGTRTGPHGADGVEPSRRGGTPRSSSANTGAMAWLARRWNRFRGAAGTRQKPRIHAPRDWATVSHDTGFRGLLSYGPADTLPGHNRRLQAQAIVRDALHHDFRFGVVAGGVGSGKTSLLASGVLPLTNARGLFVVFVRSPRRVMQEVRAASGGTGAVELGELLNDLSQRCERIAARGQLLLIIDQFEELLLDYPHPNDRQRLGAFLNRPTEAASTKVLCGVREDYLVHLRGLAPALPNPISTSALFHVENLSVAEAADIIRECAEREEAPIPPELADTIAADLAQSGLVRPPELQIVCTALRDRLTTHGYEVAGGARGILTHYIQRTLDLCADPRLARALVRALIDFETIPSSKRSPQTVVEIVERASAGGNAKTLAMAAEMLDYLERERVVAVDQGSGERRYSLVHDYLIGAVSESTADRATQNERADQLLRIYLRSMDADPGVRIPLRRLGFVTRFASPGLRQSVQAAALIAASRRRFITVVAAIISSLIVIPAVALFATSTVVWRSALISQHNSASTDGVTVIPRAPFVVTQSGARVRFWNQTDAKLSQSVDGELVAPPGSTEVARPMGSWYSGFKAPNTPTLNVVDIRSGRVFETPFPVVPGERGPLWTLQDEHIVALSIAGDGLDVGVWRIKERRETWRFASPCKHKDPAGKPFQVVVLYASRTGNSVLLRCAEGLRFERAATPSTPAVSKNIGLHHLINMYGEYAALISADDSIPRVLSVLRLEDAEVLGTRPVPGTQFIGDYFAVDGSRMFFWELPTQRQPTLMGTVVSLPGVTPPSDGPSNVQVILNSRSAPVFLWPDQDDTLVFSERGEAVAQMKVKGLRPASVAEVMLNPTKESMLVVRQMPSETTAELWKSGGDTPYQLGRVLVTTNGFTTEGDAVITFSDASTMAIYDAEEGRQLLTLKDPIGSVVSYDRACQRLHVWTGDGRVVRYARGLQIPYFGFWPSRKCGE